MSEELGRLREAWDKAVARTASLSRRFGTTQRDSLEALSDQCYASNEYIAALEADNARLRELLAQYEQPM